MLISGPSDNNNFYLVLFHSVLFSLSLDAVSNLHSQCIFSSLWGAFRPVAILQARICQLNHNNVCILTGPHLYTWVKSSNVDYVSCWRTKVLGDGWNRTRALSVRVEHSYIMCHLQLIFWYWTSLKIHIWERKVLQTHIKQWCKKLFAFRPRSRTWYLFVTFECFANSLQNIEGLDLF